MQLQLNGLRNLKYSEQSDSHGEYSVLYCGICRTDAKMWDEGQRDLVLPRVLGHEFVVEDVQSNRYIVWPAKSCGTCEYCLNQEENLCEEIEIMGFHIDGGYQSSLSLNRENLFLLDSSIPAYLGTLAEPIGCCINALEKVSLTAGERLIIYGGGTQGLVLALTAHSYGALPTIVETNEQKIKKAMPLCESLGITIVKQTHEGDFDVAINACASTIAFSMAITKLKKGGRFCFFSGLPKTKHVENNLLNIVHYKEYQIFGSYGLARNHIKLSLPILAKNSSALEYLIDEQVSPEETNEALYSVLNGEKYRIVIDINGSKSTNSVLKDEEHSPMIKTDSQSTISPIIDSITAGINNCDSDFSAEVQYVIDNKTKPVGSLGKLETVAVKCALIQKTVTPQIKNKWTMIFAADHGIAVEGVSAYPSEVTGQMVTNFLNGGAAINTLCKATGAGLSIVDMGVNADFLDEPSIINRKIRKETSNFSVKPAMTREEVITAIEGGISACNEVLKSNPVDCVAIGEMGIGNSSSAAAITSVICGISVSQVTGRGTGVDNVGLKHKQSVLSKALAFHKPNPIDPIDILAKVGGFEIAGMAGAMITCAQQGIIIVIDGFISTAAALICQLISPASTDYFIVGHKSVEIGQISALKKLALDPILDLDMRLGEGTGATLTMDLASTAVQLFAGMASFDEAGISRKSM